MVGVVEMVGMIRMGGWQGEASAAWCWQPAWWGCGHAVHGGRERGRGEAAGWFWPAVSYRTPVWFRRAGKRISPHPRIPHPLFSPSEAMFWRF